MDSKLRDREKRILSMCPEAQEKSVVKVAGELLELVPRSESLAMNSGCEVKRSNI